MPDDQQQLDKQPKPEPDEGTPDAAQRTPEAAEQDEAEQMMMAGYRKVHGAWRR